jgi:hypothetical protein
MPAAVDNSARDLIEQHGTGAVYAAVERLNQSIDEGDQTARDFWAQMVHAIHEYQRSIGSRNSRKRRVPPSSPLRADAR